MNRRAKRFNTLLIKMKLIQDNIIYYLYKKWNELIITTTEKKGFIKILDISEIKRNNKKTRYKYILLKLKETR